MNQRIGLAIKLGIAGILALLTACLLAMPSPIASASPPGPLSTLVPLSRANFFVSGPGPTGPAVQFDAGIPVNTATSPNSISSQIPGTYSYLHISPPPGQALVAGHDYGNGVPSGGTVNMGFQTSWCQGPGNFYGNVIVATTAHVDQVTMDSSGNVTAFAASVRCGVRSGNVITATWAFNVTSTTPHKGYYLYRQDGALTGFGNDNYLAYLGDLSSTRLNSPIEGMATTPSGAGYWMVASDGGVFAFGDAGSYGSMGGMPLNKPIVGMAATPDAKGYWLVASDGGIFAFGDATFHGSMGGLPLNRPIVGMAASPSGGYWLVASDGGIFAFGGTIFYGSTGTMILNKPIVGMASTLGGNGYWLVASDGGVFTFGDATFHGSTGDLTLQAPISGMDPTVDDSGYWLVATDGGVFSLDSPFFGSLGSQGLSDVAGIAS